MARRVSRPADHEGVTSLMMAASVCNVQKVKTLLQQGADLLARDKNSRNVLYHAFGNGEMTNGIIELFEVLGKYGMDFNSNLDADGCSAIVTAITLDWLDVVQLMIQYGVDVNDEGMPKFGASVSTDFALQSMENPGFDSESEPDRDRFVFSKGCGQSVSPLLCATMLKRHAIVDVLLTAQADCQQTSLGSFWRQSYIGACSVCDVRISPLHVAAYYGEVKLLQNFLLTCKTRCLTENSDLSRSITQSASPEEDITPLWLALLRGETAAVKTLLDYDHPRAPPCHFGSGLLVSLEEGHYDLAKMLLRSGYNIGEDLEWIENKMYPTTNADFKEFIEMFVNEPPSLLVLCRDALREHMGPRLSAYINTVHIPQKVVDVVMLKDVLAADDPATADDVKIQM